MSKEKLKNVLIVSLDYLLEEKYENAIKVIDDYLTSVPIFYKTIKNK